MVAVINSHGITFLSVCTNPTLVIWCFVSIVAVLFLVYIPLLGSILHLEPVSPLSLLVALFAYAHTSQFAILKKIMQHSHIRPPELTILSVSLQYATHNHNLYTIYQLQKIFVLYTFLPMQPGDTSGSKRFCSRVVVLVSGPNFLSRLRRANHQIILIVFKIDSTR